MNRIGDTELFIRLDAIPPSEVKTMKAMLTKGNFERIVVGSDELNEGVVKDRPNTSTLQPSLSRDSFYNSSTTSFGTKQGFSGSRAAFYSAFASTMKSSVSPPSISHMHSVGFQLNRVLQKKPSYWRKTRLELPRI